MSKTGAQASLAHQLVALLLVFSLHCQLTSMPVAVAAERRDAGSRLGGRVAPSDTGAAGDSKETGDASLAWSGAEADSGTASQDNSCPAQTSSPRATSLSYLGQVSGYCGAPLPAAARLTDECGNALANRQLTFTVGTQAVSATTDANGVARTSLILSPTSGSTPLAVNFAGDESYSPAQDSAQVRSDRVNTRISYTGTMALASGTTEPITATLTNALNGSPVPNAVLQFEVGSARVSATTDANGSATANINLPSSETFDRAPLRITFAGDDCRNPASAAAEVTAYLRTAFVIWGGNNERLRLGQRVNFWGHSWAGQVTAGDYKAHGDFKGYADTVDQFRLCQVSARTTATPPLNDSCWSTKPGQSFPPETLPEHIGVIVTTSMDKSGARDFGNVAALVVVKVNPSPRYGADPGKPGSGTIVAVIADGEAIFPKPPALSASQAQSATALPGQSLSVALTVSNNSTDAATNISASESFVGLAPPTASAAMGTLAASGSRTQAFGATIPALQTRREDESNQEYQKRLGAADGTVYSSLGLISFRDAAGRALPPVAVSSFSQLQLPRLTIGISAPSCASPGAAIPYVIRLTNVGSATAASATARVTFPDGTSSSVETTNLEPGKVFSQTINWTVKAIEAKGAAEADADYIARLASFDGKPLKAAVSVKWKDALGNTYGAIDQVCGSVERVPILAQTSPAPAPMLPGQKATLPSAVRNVGSGNALQARLRVTNPDASVFDAAPFGLPAGDSSNIQTTLTAPLVAPKEAAETDAAYRARLQSIDNGPIDFALALEWTDAAGNSYGPVASALRTTEVLPIVLLTLSAPETAEAGDTVTYRVTGNNVGHAEAVQINLGVTLPNGSVERVQLATPTLPPGETQGGVVNFVVPATQAEGQISAQATAAWADAASNGYGPMSASAFTNIFNPNRPPTVNAGPDQTVLLPAAAVSLNGTAEDDGRPTGSTLTVLWTKASGPGSVTFGDPRRAATTATFSAEGTYVLHLTASDSVLSASDETTVQVMPAPTGETYSGTADLADGEGVNIVPDEFNHLHLNNEATPFNFIWVAVSSKGTIVKIDTDTGQVVGEYFSSPAGQPKDPSRTTVDHNGNVWASNRAGNSVLRIGLAENGQCVDRNGNGVIDTSRGQGDIRPWPNTGGVDTDGGVETAADECIINYTRVRSSGTRHVSVNMANDVWVSGVGGQKFDLIDGTTGLIKRQEPSVGYGGYGGLIDRKGVIWSARPLLRWDTALPLTGANGGNWKGWGHDSYGLCIDSKGNVWNTALNGNIIRKFAPDGTLVGTFDHGDHYAQGCVVDRNDHVWVAHSLNDHTVGHLLNDGTWLGNVPVGNGPTGVAADAKGKIWATNFNSRTVSRIDPELGPIGRDGTTRVGQVDLTTVDLKGNLYNYSDMTGSTLVGAPASGTWTQVFDSGIAGATWGVIGWNGQVCGDGSLLVKASSSSDGQQFSAPVVVENGAAFSLPAGRYLKVSVIFKRSSGGESPFLFDLTVGTRGYNLPPGENAPPTVDAGPDQTATMPNSANLVGSACDSGRVGGLSINWEKVSGPGTVTFANARVPATSATFSEAGEYVLRLTAGDSNLSSSDEMTVLVLPFNDAPVVNAGADQAVVLPAALNLQGAVSDDRLPVNSTLAVSWSKLSGPGEVTFTNATAATTTATFSEVGEYTLRLTGDDSQLVNVDDLVVKVFPPNIAPAVNAGEDKTIRLPDKAALDGTVTDDGLPLGKTVTVAWSKVSGPGTVSFAKASAADTTAAFSQPGTYVLRLTAGDSQLSSSDELRVVVNPANQPPSVNAGADQTITLPAVAHFSGTVSDDELPEGRTVTTTWSKVSGPGLVTFGSPDSPATTASFSEAGTYVLRLSASDSALSRSDDVAIVVNPSPVNLPPTVKAGADQTITLPAKASLSGVAADDKQPVGSKLTAAWSKVSGPGTVTFGNAAAPATTATFSTAGEYVLRLTASDTALTTTDEVAITVLPVNQPPVIKAGTDQTINFPAVASLRGTATDDGLPAGGRLTTVWSKVSGPGDVSFADASAAATSATFSTGGKYVLRLTASDSALSRSDDVTVIVNQPPSVEAGADQTIHMPTAANLRGTVSDDALPPGKIIVVAWSKVSGPGTVTFSKPNAAATAAAFSEVGTYVLRLSANDSLLEDSDEMTVTVNPPLPPPPMVAIASPTDGAEITSRANIVGSVSRGNWKLDYSLGPDVVSPNNSVWTTLASGSTPVTSAVLGTLDPTLLLNGTYALRLTATDADGQTASATRSVIVAGQQKIGNFTVSFEDLNVPVAGLPIQLMRTYDSRDKRTGDFGVGWTLSIRNVRLEKSVELGRYWRGIIAPGALPSYCLQATRPNIVTVTLPDDRVYKFQATTTKQCQAIAPIEFARFGFTPMPGTKGTLVPEAPLDVTVMGDFPGPVELLNAADPQLRTFDPTVFRFTDEDGVTYVIDQKLGVRSVADPNGNRLTINRDGIIHSSGKSVSFVRDAQGRITQIIDPDGNTLTYTYDANGDLTAFQDQENNQTRFTYNAVHYLLSIVDPRGVQPIRNEYDDNGRLISHTDATGKTITYSHNLNARQEAVTDRLGNLTVFEYDARGNLLKETDPLGGVTTYSYDARGNQLSKTDPVGRTVTATYDASDNLLSRTDALGNVVRFTYNARRQLLTTTDPLGHVTTNTYDSEGNLISTKGPDGAVTSYTYTANGLPKTVTDKAGNTASFEYDKFGNLTKDTDPLGHVTLSAYSANGQRLSQTTQRTTPSGVETLSTTYEYDKRGYLVKTNFPDGTSKQEVYDGTGKRSAVIDEMGRRTTFTYDARGKLVETAYPDGTKEEATFDAEGRRVSFTDRAGHTTRFAFDAAGRLVKTTDASGAEQSSLYDAAGQLLSSTDERGSILKYEYDAAGRRTKITDALGNSTTFTYYANQSVRTMTDALNHTITFEYDAMGRRTRIIYPDGTSSGVTYDAMSRQTGRVDQAGKRTSYEYDKLGRLIRVTDALGQATSYTYDELGNMTSQTDANGHQTKFQYDATKHLVRRTLPMGMSESYAYDAAGNLTQKTDFNGKVTSLAYDSMNQLIEKIPDPSLGQPKITYSYTPTGKRSRMTDASGTTLYTYDQRDRLTSKATPEGTLTYTYDAAGNVQSIRSSHPNGADVSYLYDTLNRLGSVTDNNAQGGTTRYNYDAVGNLAKTAYPNGLETSYTYDGLNRLTDLSAKKRATLLASYTYTLGPTGNRLSVAELNGRRVSYTYDDVYRMTGESIAGAPGVNGAITYSLDQVGNRQSRNSTVEGVPSMGHAYDANDRLTGETYDANGNPTTKGGRSFSYDFENRLTDINDGAVRFVYDGDGNRVSKTAGGVTTKYLVDDLNPTGYAQVLEELVNGEVRRVYTYGHDLISQRQLIGGGWHISYYGYDGHGSVRYLTDAGGSVTDTYDYDAYGNLLQRTGTTPNLYLYAGEQYDPDLGYVYLRARYMEQETGRFLTMDSVWGRAYDPVSLHKYLYAHASPADYVDPSGKDALYIVLFVFAVIDLIAASIVATAVWKIRLELSLLEPMERATVRRAITIIELGGVLPISRTLWHMYTTGRIQKRPIKYATTLPVLNLITLDQSFFTPGKKESPVDEVERAVILLHEGAHRHGDDEMLGAVGSENYAYKVTWYNKEKIAWVRGVYGEPRPGGATELWDDVKSNISDEAPELLHCDQDQAIPRDQCLP